MCISITRSLYATEDTMIQTIYMHSNRLIWLFNTRISQPTITKKYNDTNNL
ncbi:hypothetical protein KSS87_017885 [Heliosperma pusillum]|nr:hypothetical protein KSS87_017885 [Heliosperma pusillum]